MKTSICLLFFAAITSAEDSVDRLVAKIGSAKDLDALGNPTSAEIGLGEGASRTDPRLRKALGNFFDRTTDPRTKRVVSSWMLAARENDPRYFRHVERQLRNVLSIDPPYYVGGSFEVNESFPAWCASQGIALTACENKFIVDPQQVIITAIVSKDIRFLPLLRECLSSNTYWRHCAGGLAAYKDIESVPAVIKRLAAIGDPKWPLRLTAWDDPAVDQIAIEFAKSDPGILKELHERIAARKENKKQRVKGAQR